MTRLVRSNTLIIFMALMLGQYLLFSPKVKAAADPVGRTVSIIGEVTLVHESESKRIPVAVPNPVFLHDTISSGVGSRGKFMMKDDSILKLGPDSVIELNELVVDADGQKTTIKELQGHLRILLGKKLKPNSHFRVQTPVAVAGVRGTDFEVWVRTPVQTIIRCYEGEVAIENLLENIAGEVALPPNHYTVVEEGKPPIEPVPISPETPLSAIFSEVKKSDSKSSDKSTSDEKEERVEAKEGKPDSEPAASGEPTTSSVQQGDIAGLSQQQAGTGTANSSSPVTEGASGSVNAGTVTAGVTSAVTPSAGTGTPSAGTGFAGAGESGTASASKLSIDASLTTYTGITAVVDPIDKIEADKLPTADLTEKSSTGSYVMSSIGLDVPGMIAGGSTVTAAGVAGTGSADGVATEKLGDVFVEMLATDAMDTVIDTLLSSGVETTISEPILESGSVSFDVTFPTP